MIKIIAVILTLSVVLLTAWWQLRDNDCINSSSGNTFVSRSPDQRHAVLVETKFEGRDLFGETVAWVFFQGVPEGNGLRKGTPLFSLREGGRPYRVEWDDGVFIVRSTSEPDYLGPKATKGLPFEYKIIVGRSVDGTLTQVGRGITCEELGLERI